MSWRISAAQLCLSLLALAACSPSGPTFKATDITGSNVGGNFALPDHNGKVQRLADHRGKVVIVTFGFTSCPDVCPTTLLTLSQALKKLGPSAEKAQVFMITVDPARDTPQTMARYVPSFHPAFLGLVPNEEALKEVAKQFKVYINRNKPNADGFYTVDHSAASFVFDGQGRIRLFVPHERGSDDWAADLRRLMQESS